MKFSFKIFFSSFIIITLSFGIGAYLLIYYVFNSSLNSEVDLALKENSYYYSSFYNAISSDVSSEKQEANSTIENIFMPLANSSKSLVRISDNKGVICSNTLIVFNDNIIPFKSLPLGMRSHRIVNLDNKYYVQCVSKVIEGNRFIYIENIQDITDLYAKRSKLVNLYILILLGVIASSSIIMTLISILLTSPLKKLSLTAEKIANGDFSSRVKIKSKDEVGILSRDFNKMADVIEEKIHELETTAAQREEFVASFSHELKTPLTSIIGYSDSLRSLNMSEENRFECANYIFTEGKRLEELSLRLMDLIILNKNDFNMSKINGLLFMEDITNSLKPVIEKYNCTLNVNVDKGMIIGEPVLLKTLFYNLIDNALKASNENCSVNITGVLNENTYIFKIEDLGQGIPEDDLIKITEPFYMVDKSRLKREGYGLGLSICKEICLIHNTKLNFKSKLNNGTIVEFTLGGEKIE